MTSTRVSFCALALLVAACTKDEKKSDPTPVASVSAAVAAVDAGPPPAPAKLITTWGKDVGLKAPESVLHDTEADVYFVSNVDGKPLDVDGKGFISKLAPEAMGYETRWIDSGKKGVTLNAPKGMGITGDVLWVADIDTVRTFDRKTGKPTGEVKIPGATFLNDIAVMPDGRVVVSDSGLKAKEGGGFEKAGTDAVYTIDKDRKVSTVAKSPELGGPNGLFPVADKMWVVTFESDEIYVLDTAGKRSGIEKLPKGGLDGIALGKSDYFVSSWDGSRVYRGRPGLGGKTWEVAIDDIRAPADIMYDKTRNRLIVPMMTDDQIRAYELP